MGDTPNGPLPLGDRVTTLIPLPDGAVPLAAVEVVEYLDVNGERHYAFRFPVGEPVSTSVGLLEMAKIQLINMFNKQEEG